MRAAGGCFQHLAVDDIVSLRGIKLFGGAASAFSGAPEVEKKWGDAEDGQRSRRDPSHQRPRTHARKRGIENHLRPFRQSSTRAQIATAMPAKASAMNSQRRLSR